MDTKTLLIMRHGQAENPWGPDDRMRQLTPFGRKQAEQAGQFLVSEGLAPDGAVVSDAVRTRATYAMAASALGEEAPSAYLEPDLYATNAAGLLKVVNHVPDTISMLMVVAHMPAVQDAAMRLASPSSEEAAVMDMAENYPPASLCVFEVEAPWATLDGRDASLQRFITFT